MTMSKEDKYYKVVESMKECGRWGTIHTHKDCGAKVYAPYKCGFKWHRKCYKDWSKKVWQEVYGVVKSYRWTSHLVLTVKNDVSLDRQRKTLLKAFVELRRRKIWKSVKRGVVFMGLTYNGNEWHYHLHLIVDCVWIDAEKLTEAWTDIVGECERNNTYVKRCRGDIRGLVTEVVKGTRGDMRELLGLFEANESLFMEAVNVLWGKKWYWWIGKKPNLVKRDTSCYCPRCGARFYWREWTREKVKVSEFIKRARSPPYWKDYYYEFAYKNDKGGVVVRDDRFSSEKTIKV